MRRTSQFEQRVYCDTHCRCITTPAAAITVAQESSSSSGCITTPVAAIFVVGTSSGTAVSTLPDSVVHTRTSGKAGKRRGGEKEEEQHTQISAAHTRASSPESQPPSRRVKKLHAKHVTGGAGA